MNATLAVTKGKPGKPGKLREHGWRGGESTRFPPMWPGFDSQIPLHMLVEFLVLFSGRFFSGYSGFLRFLFQLRLL